MRLYPPLPRNRLLLRHCSQVRGVGMCGRRLNEEDLCSLSMDGVQKTRELGYNGFRNGNCGAFSGDCFDEDQELR